MLLLLRCCGHNDPISSVHSLKRGLRLRPAVQRVDVVVSELALFALYGAHADGLGVDWLAELHRRCSGR